MPLVEIGNANPKVIKQFANHEIGNHFANPRWRHPGVHNPTENHRIRRNPSAHKRMTGRGHQNPPHAQQRIITITTKEKKTQRRRYGTLGEGGAYGGERRGEVSAVHGAEEQRGRHGLSLSLPLSL